MTFKEVLAQVIEWLQQDGRVSYLALKRQFDLDDDYLEDVKASLAFSHPQACDENGQGLVWKGETPAPTQHPQAETDSETRFQALLLAVIPLLQREKRLTYRTLSHTLGVGDALLAEIRSELTFKRLAIDEDGKGLVWISEGHPPPPAPAHAEIPSVSPLAASVHPPIVIEAESQTDGPAASPEEPHTEIRPDESDTLIQPVRSAAGAEHRQLTVMFCDLVGSTDLSGKLDPEDLREVVRAYQETAAAVIARYEGYIAQYLGDGLLIYFGFPVAHEDDAHRAVYTGLGLPEAMATLNTRLEAEYGVQLAVRIGIHTGPVVVGEMGGGGRHENLALGETPNIAARLEGLATPNSVVLSSVTAQLVQRSFVLDELGDHELKGVAEPMRLFGVVGEREIDEVRDSKLTRAPETLVGRDEEIGLLRRRWEQSQEGLGQVVLISGDAGIGKSTLIDGLRNHVRRAGLTHIVYRCSPYHTNSALYPVVTHLEHVLGFEHGDDAATKLDKLEQGLRTSSLTLDETVPPLASLLAVPFEGRYPTPSLSPPQQKQQTLDALNAWLGEEADRQPVLAVWEDMHWADPSTIEALSLLIDQAPTMPILHVLTFRPEFSPPWPMRSHMTPIMLNRLERLQVEALITQLLDGKSLPREVTEHIVTKTDGVPLYVEELTKMLLVSDLLRQEADQFVLTGPLSSVAIPDTLQDSLMARLDQMSRAKEVAQLGAVLGREFRYDVIQGIASKDEETLQSGLAELVEAELLYQRGRPPRARYIFKHALIQDIAYQSLLRGTRQQFHHQIAQMLEARFPETVETQPELIAYHYTEGNGPDLAVTYWQQAGQVALQRSAHLETIGHLTQGLKLIESLPNTREHAEQELAMRTTLGQSLMVTQGYTAPELERSYLRARELCQQVEDTTQLSSVLAGLRRFYHVRAEYDTALEIGQELLCLAQAQQDPTILLWGQLGVAPPLILTGELVEGHQHLERCLAIYDQQAHRDLTFRYGTNPIVTCCMWISISLWLLGYVDQAMEKSNEAHRLAEAFDSLFNRVIAGSSQMTIHCLHRKYEAAQEHADAMMALSLDQGIPDASSRAMVMRGWALAMQGQTQSGIAELKQGMADRWAMGARINSAENLVLLAQAYEQAGQIEEGLGAVAEAQAHIEATREKMYQAEVYRLKGSLLLTGPPAHQTEAEACFQAALETAQQQQAKSLELRAARDLSRLWQQQGKYGEARELLAEVYSWFTEGFDTADLKEAKILLEELSV